MKHKLSGEEKGKIRKTRLNSNRRSVSKIGKILAQNWKNDPMNLPKAFGELNISRTTHQSYFSNQFHFYLNSTMKFLWNFSYCHFGPYFLCISLRKSRDCIRLNFVQLLGGSQQLPFCLNLNHKYNIRNASMHIFFRGCKASYWPIWVETYFLG